uniref:Uncharacterized protein n=1 Tax=Vespula pensylvanica TaxID=30213 RepID=A0A834KMD4_VESPE|nr:hypothetical protein H0235_014210 [Vespula pensylvanica]
MITYSNSCTGQNENIKTVLSLLKLFQSIEIRTESIEVKFLVDDHIQMTHKDFFSTKPLENSIINRTVTNTEVPVN